MSLQPYQQRVVDEKADLDLKIGNLMKFMKTADFAEIERAEQKRMAAQSTVMRQYSAILGERIAAFNRPVAPIDAAARLKDAWL